MKKYFNKQSYNEDYDDLKTKLDKTVYENLKEQHKLAVSSLENFRKYKKSVNSFEEVPSYKLKSSDYKYIHSVNVSIKCKRMAAIENISEDIMEMIGLCHDISHYLCDYERHGYMSGKIAGEFFSKNSKFNNEDIKIIEKIIESHYPLKWNEEYYLSEHISIEEIILLECDFWDKIDLASFCEASKISDKSLLQEKYTSMQEKGNILLELPESEQECIYTNSFKDIIKEQIKENKRYYNMNVISSN